MGTAQQTMWMLFSRVALVQMTMMDINQNSFMHVTLNATVVHSKIKIEKENSSLRWMTSSIADLVGFVAGVFP